jgi:hypothetical protein
MNIFSTVIVTNAKKAEAQEVLNKLYSVPAMDDQEAYVSTAGNDFFNIELKKGTRKYWASSGAFVSSELTALTNSGVSYYTSFGNDFQAALDTCELLRIDTAE